MGMYTELMIRAEIDAEAYEELQIRSNKIRADGGLFSSWRVLGLLDATGSFYFPQANHFRLEQYFMGEPAHCRYVSFRANIKNYDHEIEKFIDWLVPHIVDTRFIGYKMYEEDEMPTLLFVVNGDLVMQ